MTPTSTLRRGRAGISIVEILVTVVLLAVGALAALGLQVSALRASGTAESLQTLTRVAESELQFRRGIDRGGAALADAGTCRVFVPDSMTCTVVISPCALVAGALDCSTVTAASATAHEVRVTTTGGRGSDVVLTGLVATVASAATGGADGVGSGSGGGEDGDGGGTPGPTPSDPAPEPEPDPEPEPEPGNGGGNGNGNGGGKPVACTPGKAKKGEC